MQISLGSLPITSKSVCLVLVLLKLIHTIILIDKSKNQEWCCFFKKKKKSPLYKTLNFGKLWRYARVHFLRAETSLECSFSLHRAAKSSLTKLLTSVQFTFLWPRLLFLAIFFHSLPLMQALAFFSHSLASLHSNIPPPKHMYIIKLERIWESELSFIRNKAIVYRHARPPAV